MHFEPIKWILVIVRCIACCLYLGFQLAKRSPHNGYHFQPLVQGDFDSEFQYMKASHDG